MFSQEVGYYKNVVLFGPRDFLNTIIGASFCFAKPENTVRIRTLALLVIRTTKAIPSKVKSTKKKKKKQKHLLETEL